MLYPAELRGREMAILSVAWIELNEFSAKRIEKKPGACLFG